MSAVSTFEAVKAYLIANWNDTPLVFENDKSQLPAQAAAFVYVEVFGNSFSQQSIGDPGRNVWRERGQIMLHIMTKRGAGSREARVLADNMAALFREAGPESFDITEMSLGAGEPGEGDGNYWRYSLVVPFERDDIPA